MKKAKVERETTEEIDLLDDMLSSLVDLLIEKGINGRGIRKANQTEGQGQIGKDVKSVETPIVLL
jgi:hypothetical protein